jgi:hypothetical protein
MCCQKLPHRAALLGAVAVIWLALLSDCASASSRGEEPAGLSYHAAVSVTDPSVERADVQVRIDRIPDGVASLSLRMPERHAFVKLDEPLVAYHVSGGSWQVQATGCEGEGTLTAAENLDGVSHAFDVYWPPRDPQEVTSVPVRPLLRGRLALEAKRAVGGGGEVWLAITITRPSEEIDRQFWNEQLAFADIAWMNEVRVWDAEKKWLWPNLPYLLRLPGQERVERYGGMDPGKGVDNDFAAVLIRKCDARGEAEMPETKDSPLVSAEWRAEGGDATDAETVVHVAKSDSFVLHLGQEGKPASGRLKVWLIYADFLGARPPRTWPKQREWAGGILAYFEIDWEATPGHACRGVVVPKRPEQGTGFEWAEWVSRTPGSHESRARIRLSDTDQ